MAILSPDDRLLRFLGPGYLPRELPPPFVSKDFAKYGKAVATRWPPDGLSAPKTRPDTFSIPRHGRTSRRRLAIVNPISHFYLASEIAREWDQIATLLSSSAISSFQSVFSVNPNRTFEPIDFEEIEERKTLILSRYNKALVSDISRFYPTLYTHVIAWAAQGKDWCKQHQHEAVFRQSLGNRLDVLVRKGQDNQSVGIPIGPETSRVVAEIVGVGIDKLVSNSVVLNTDRAYRYVDDLCVGVEDGQSVDGLVAELSRALSSFELEINVEKTREIDVRGEFQPDWVIELRNFELPSGPKAQRRALDYYFKKSFHLGGVHTNQNVLNYAVKRNASFAVETENWSLYEAYIMRCVRSNSTTIEPACQILVDAFRRKRAVGLKWVAKLVDDTIRERAPLGQHGEVAWSLFLARELNLRIGSTAACLLSEMESGVCALLALDLHHKGLLDAAIDVSNWMTFLNTDGFRSPMWLMAYEAPRKGWLPVASLDFIARDDYFGVLHDLDISFYDSLRTVRPVHKQKRKAGDSAWPPVEFFGYT
jgi:hypothetical protein